ncbi:MAG TPA: NlpC/P60 family protein [Streptosporangiaceae bacterium]|nr:NlpC/P60 family protein [Streptosporangiaceae bacterium]
MHERITRCASGALSVKLRSVVQAAFAAIVLLIASTALARPLPAHAASAAPQTAAKMRSLVWRYALRQKGKPYIYGDDGPAGFDCSGLVYAAYRAAGIALPRTTYGMLGSWRLVRVSRARAQRGDLAFFGTGHVEIYDAGNWTYGAADAGTRVGFHKMNAFWHPTMYFIVRA